MYHCGENEVPRDLARAVFSYKTAPRFGNQPMAMNALAILHEYGWGVKDSKVLALQRFVKTACAGSEMALSNLGRIHIWIDSGLCVGICPRRLKTRARLEPEINSPPTREL